MSRHKPKKNKGPKNYIIHKSHEPPILPLPRTRIFLRAAYTPTPTLPRKGGGGFPSHARGTLKVGRSQSIEIKELDPRFRGDDTVISGIPYP
jgi:hypothetical protein